MAEPWTKFRNLCQYYADCVKYSEHSQEYLFPNQLHKEFMIPNLPSGWLLKEEEFVVNTVQEDAFVRARLLEAADEDELFVGYPLNAFVSPTGTECLCPIMMFPVSMAVRGAGFTTGFRMQIDRQGISLNQDWIDYHIPREEQKAFRSACVFTEDENGSLDVEMVLNYISTHYNGVSLNPNRMQFDVRRSQAKKGLLNTAVLFVGSKTKYTKTLIAELKRISKESDAVLDRTALAYVFREPCLSYQSNSEKRIPVSFTSRPLNAGQFEATEKALNSPIVKVMGPPGTGKSFMSVNLMANEVLAGGSVLFTSKNHKAIHAIFDKVPDAIRDKEFPLVSFCTTPDNPTNADWQKSQKDVDARMAKLEAARHSRTDFISGEKNGVLGECATEKLDSCLSRYRDAEVHIERYQNLRGLLSRYERLLGQVEIALKELPVRKFNSDGLEHLLEESAALLEAEEKQSLLLRMIDAIQQRFCKKGIKLNVSEQLQDIAPHIANAFVSRKTAAKEIRRLLKLLKCRKLIKEWERTEYEALKIEQSALNYDDLKSLVKQALEGAQTIVQEAYRERMLSLTKEIEHEDVLVAACKKALEEVRPTLDFLATIDDGTKYEEALKYFKEYLKIFPAWASTMLSLRRTSPCLPAVFTLVIIDEASQCEIPPMIPALFRAQRAAIIGDPNQFPPVITLKASKDKAFRRKSHMDTPEYNKFIFRSNNVFSVVPGDAILLNEHFRCADEIAEYFNVEFYKGQLSLCNELGRTGESAVGALHPGMMWIDAEGGDSAEIEAAIEYLRGLKNHSFEGTIGVISPLRELVNQMKTRAKEYEAEIPTQLDIETQINTANGFQGGECDVILFLLGLNGDRTRGQGWYITATENKYIYNVSVSRAKRIFVAFGDRKRVSSCGLSYIQKLIPEARPPRKEKIGPGEIYLRLALERAGIKVVPQYSILGRYLDLAIPEKKIDIEVDGQAWHLDSRGGRKADDIHRDIQLETAGWWVIRFWHYEVVSDITSCVNKIRNLIEA